MPADPDKRTEPPAIVNQGVNLCFGFHSATHRNGTLAGSLRFQPLIIGIVVRIVDPIKPTCSNLWFYYWLVVDLPLWKIWVRQLGFLFQTKWKNKFHVPKHQICGSITKPFIDDRPPWGRRRGHPQWCTQACWNRANFFGEKKLTWNPWKISWNPPNHPSFQVLHLILKAAYRDFYVLILHITQPLGI